MAEKLNFMQRVSAAQIRLKAPKNQRNSFGNYNYRSCEDILEAVKPILNDLNLVLNLSDKMLIVGDRYYIEATATLYDAESTEHLSSTALARESETKKGMDDSQITGTASSYARKYALNGLFNIDDTKDADTDEHAKQTTQAKPSAQKTYTKQTKEIITPAVNTVMCDNCGAAIEPETVNGKVYNVDKVVMASQKKFGKCLCAKCRAEEIEKRGIQI